MCWPESSLRVPGGDCLRKLHRDIPPLVHRLIGASLRGTQGRASVVLAQQKPDRPAGHSAGVSPAIGQRVNQPKPAS